MLRRDFINGLIAAFVGLLLPWRSNATVPKDLRPSCEICGKPATWETVDTVVQDVPRWSRICGRWHWSGHVEGPNHRRCDEHPHTRKEVESVGFQQWLAWRGSHPNGTGEEWLAFCNEQTI